MTTTPRQKLLDAVIAAALADGIADKSLRAIAESSNTSHRMLIHHFGSKENLFVEIIRAIEARQREGLEGLLAGADTAPDELNGYWKQLRSPELARQERLFFEVYGQALQGRTWAQPVLEGVVSDWVDSIGKSLEGRGLPGPLARTVARLSLAVTRGLLLDVLATGEESEVDAAMLSFQQMLASYLERTLTGRTS